MIQANAFLAHDSVTVLLLSSAAINAPLLRINIKPSAENGLQLASQIMIDKAMTVKADKIGATFGRIDADTLLRVERCLAVFLGIAN